SDLEAVGARTTGQSEHRGERVVVGDGAARFSMCHSRREWSRSPEAHRRSSRYADHLHPRLWRRAHHGAGGEGRGSEVLDRAIQQRRVAECHRGEPSSAAALHVLTGRNCGHSRVTRLSLRAKWEIMALLVSGLLTQIAAVLGIRQITVKARRG